VVDGERRTFLCFALQGGQQERSRSDVLEVDMSVLEAEVDRPA
jgi:hypothetical protein